MSKRLLLRILPLSVISCAGPMASTAVLLDRGPDGGTVRIVCPGYPPDSGIQAKVSEEMHAVCAPRSWKVVDVALRDVVNPRGVESLPGGSGGWVSGGQGQQIDLKFVCLAR